MRITTPAAAALFATILASAAPAHAVPAAPLAPQSQSDLQKEVDRLRQENQQLKQQLADAADRIKKLEADKAAQPAAPAAAPTAPAATPPADAAPEVVPADPNLGPAGLLSSIQADYLSAFSSAPAQPNNPKEQIEFNAHIKKLQIWANQANAKVRTLTWVGRIDSSSMRNAGPNRTGLDFIFGNGNSTYRVPVTLNDAQLSRVRMGNMVDFGDLAVTAVVRPRLRVDDARPVPAAFESRRMAAPYLLFGFDYEVKSVLPVAQAKEPATK